MKTEIPEASSNNTLCESDKVYSHAQELLANTPYILMLLLGGAILGLMMANPVGRYLVAGLYIFYGILGAVWIMIFVCPYCHFYDTRACPCGYGQFAAKLVSKKDGSRFGEKFKKHIPVIVPLWFIPPIAAGVSLFRGFSWWMLVLLCLFALNSFLILPLLSRQHCCSSCPQKDTCPWMG